MGRMKQWAEEMNLMSQEEDDYFQEIQTSPYDMPSMRKEGDKLVDGVQLYNGALQVSSGKEVYEVPRVANEQPKTGSLLRNLALQRQLIKERDVFREELKAHAQVCTCPYFREECKVSRELGRYLEAAETKLAEIKLKIWSEV